MLILAIITGLIALASVILCLVRGFSSDWDNGFWPFISAVVFGIIWLIAFCVSMQFSPGTQHYTGYIYTTSNRFGYTTADIRYSQNAGVDTQPTICAPSNSKAGQEMVAVAGTNKKVNITVPSYFYFAENPFACGTSNITVDIIQ